jgi:hypothetical protein
MTKPSALIWRIAPAPPDYARHGLSTNLDFVRHGLRTNLDYVRHGLCTNLEERKKTKKIK